LEYAESIYRDILNEQPLHADANHNLGIIALQVKRSADSLPYLKAAMEAEPERTLFRISYTTALIQAGQLVAAEEMVALAVQNGVQGLEVESLVGQLEAAKKSDIQSVSKQSTSDKGSTWFTVPPKIGENYWQEPDPVALGRGSVPRGYFFGISPTLGFTALNQFFSAIGTTDGSYASDNLIAWERNLSFMRDEKFMKAFETNLVGPTDGGILWRRAVHYWAAKHCSGIEGDFVECGVWMGTGAKTVCDAIDFQDTGKCYWLYDIFDYKDGDQHGRFEGLDSTLFDKIKERFSGINTRIIKGYVPKSFELGMPEKIAMLHIDMNSAAAEVAALEHLFPRLSRGGIVLLDDYGWAGYIAQNIAENEYFSRMDHLVLELPTGQGLVIKK